MSTMSVRLVLPLTAQPNKPYMPRLIAQPTIIEAHRDEV